MGGLALLHRRRREGVLPVRNTESLKTCGRGGQNTHTGSLTPRAHRRHLCAALDWAAHPSSSSLFSLVCCVQSSICTLHALHAQPVHISRSHHKVAQARRMLARACAAPGRRLLRCVAARQPSARCLSAVAAAAPTVFEAHDRLEVGSRESRRARQHGLIPGIVYGSHQRERRVYVQEEAIRVEMRKKGDTFLSCMVDL